MKQVDNHGVADADLERGHLKGDKTMRRVRDNVVENDSPLVETMNGGFLGRTESHLSQSFED